MDDPLACLTDAAAHLQHAAEREEAAECLSDYFEWRIKGGFQPPGGDKRFCELLVALGNIADTLGEALEVHARR